MSCRSLLVLTALPGLPAAVRADPPACECPRYYVLLFGGQAERFRPRTAHTWATFVRAEPRPGGVALDTFTISWLPCRMPVRPFALRSNPGRNYSLHETLDLFSTGRSDLSLWGPYEIREDWYREAEAHKAVLDGGAVRFKTLDGALVGWQAAGPRRPELSHCVHAVTRTDEALRRAANPVTWYGELITRKVATAMTDVGLLVNPAVAHDWLIPALGIEGYQFKRRRVGEPLIALLR